MASVFNPVAVAVEAPESAAGDVVAERGPVARWVERAREGDRAAFEALYRRFSPVVHGVLLARVPPALAADLVHDVFITVLRRLPELREAEAFPGWIVSIAKHQASSALRRPLPVEAPETSRRASAEVSHDARRALAAIQDLPEAYRDVLLLRLVEGLTGPEIAEHTGLTHGSVRVNLHRGMRLLREALGHVNAGGDHD